MSRNEFVWVEKYRPQTIDECILPDNIKKTFKDFLEQGENKPVTFWTTWMWQDHCRLHFCNELGVDVYVINGSDEGRFLDNRQK